MQKAGRAFFALALVLAAAYLRGAAQTQLPPLPPNKHVDCSEIGVTGHLGENCTLTIQYSYSGAYFVQEKVQDSEPKPNSHLSTKTFHERVIDMYTAALPRKLMREAEVQHTAVTADDFTADVAHLEYMINDKRYVESCSSKTERGVYDATNLYTIANENGVVVDGRQITTFKEKDKETVTYSRPRPPGDKRGQGMDEVPPFKDPTRCTSSTFPFGMVREPNLRPPTM